MSSDRKCCTEAGGDVGDCIDYAKCMKSAEEEIRKQLLFRGRLVTVSTTAMLTLVASIAFIGRKEWDSSPSFHVNIIMLMASGVSVAGIALCILATHNYIFHGEEDAGALPNRGIFFRIGLGWWLTQPTIDSVEEMYLYNSILNNLEWRNDTEGRGIYRVWEWLYITCGLKKVRWKRKIGKVRKKFCEAMEKEEDLYDVSMKYYRESVTYGGGYGVYGIRERSPKDLSCLLLSLAVMEESRVWPCHRDKEEYCGIYPRRRRSGFSIVDDVCKRFVEYLDVLDSCVISEGEYDKGSYAGSLGLPMDLRSIDKGDLEKQELKVEISRKHNDLLHHPVLNIGSNYFLQFGEAYAYKYLGRGKLEPGGKGGGSGGNPVESGRTWFEFDKSTLDRSGSPNFSQHTWRIFISLYSVAQDMRSGNWNLWFRVKRSERLYLSGLTLILVAFGLFLVARNIDSFSSTEPAGAHRPDYSNTGGDMYCFYHSGPPV